MKTIKKLSLFLSVMVAIFIFSGCSGMLDIPRRFPFFNNFMTLFGQSSPGVSVTSSNGAYFVSENYGVLDIRVVLNAQPTADVFFTITSSDLAEASLSVTDFTFTPSNWSTPQTVRVTGVDEYIADGNKNVPLVFGSIVSADPLYNGMAVPSAPLIVLDDELYSITVSPRTLQTTEAAGASHTATFYVALSIQPTFDVMIPVITSGNITEGTIDKSSLTFTSSNWDTPQAVTVTAVDDGVEDGNKSYTITLASSVSLDPGYNGIALGPVSVTNLDANSTITVTPLSMDLVEGGDNADWGNYQGTFSVVLTSAPSGNVTIDVTSGSPRATVDTPLLTFTTGNWNTPHVVIVSAVDNGVIDPEVPVTIDLGTAHGFEYEGKEPSDVAVNITDNDGAGIRVSRMSRETREAGLQDATFRVRLNKQPALGTTVIIPINDTYDIKNYQHKEGSVDKLSLTFNTANWATEQVVTVTPVKDYVMDGDVQYIIGLMPCVSADPDYNGKKPRNVTVNNFNEDTAGFVVRANGTTTTMGTGNQSFNGFATDDMGNLGSQYATFEVKLRSKPLSNVTLNLSSDSTTNDGTLSVPSLTFTPSNWDVFQTARVTGASNGANEGNHDYTINTSITTADSVYGNVGATYVGKPSFVIRSCDNDVAKEIVDCACSGSNTSSTSESGGQAIFYLITKSAPGSAVTVNFSVDDPTEGIPPSSGTVIITGSNYNQLASAGSNKVAVTGADDVAFDGTVVYHLIPALSTGGLSYLIPGSYILSNADNEVRFISSVAGHTSENITTTTINFRLGAQPSADVTLSVACMDLTECRSVSPASLTFTNGDWNSNQQITVTGEDDAIADGNVSSTIRFTASSADGIFNGQIHNVSVINDDNEQAKAIWVTSVNRNGEMAPGVSTADSYCNGTDPNKPTGLGSPTYKALIVDGLTRVATTDGSTNAGQTGWVLTPGHHYYQRIAGSGDGVSTLLFIANANGLIPFPMQRSFSGASDNYWIGMNPDMTTVPTIGVDNQCDKWTLTNDPSSPFADYYGQYGVGGATSASAISSGSATCDSVKKIICVQQ